VVPVPALKVISLKKPAKTREELESAIRLEMEDISGWPTDLAISVVPHEDSWKVEINELVTNAAKHAYSDKSGEIQVTGAGRGADPW
jgi:hypothetical protein